MSIFIENLLRHMVSIIVQFIQSLEALFHKKLSKSQKVIIYFIEDQFEPGINWLVYDSE